MAWLPFKIKEQCLVCKKYLNNDENISPYGHDKFICLKCMNTEYEKVIQQNICDAVDKAWEKNTY